MKNHKDSMRLPLVLILAMLAGMFVTLIVLVIVAFLISSEKMAPTGANIGVTVSVLLGAMVTSAITAGKTGRMRIIMSIAGAAVYLVMLFCLAAILFDGAKNGIGATVLTVLGSAMAVCLLGIKGKKRNGHRLPKMRILPYVHVAQ